MTDINSDNAVVAIYKAHTEAEAAARAAAVSVIA